MLWYLICVIYSPYLLNNCFVLELKKIDIKIIIDKSVTTAPYNSSLFKMSTISLLYSLYKSQKVLTNIIKKEEIHIVYLNTMMMYPYSIVPKKMGLKVVMHMRENWPINEHKRQFMNARRIISKYVDKINTYTHTTYNTHNTYQVSMH